MIDSNGIVVPSNIKYKSINPQTLWKNYERRIACACCFSSKTIKLKDTNFILKYNYKLLVADT